MKFYVSDSVVLAVLQASDSTALLELAKTRMKTLKEFKDLVIPAPVELNQEEKEVASLFKSKLQQLQKWDKESILTVVREVLKEKKVKGGLLYKIMTGREHGLPLPESLELLGKKETLGKLS